MPKTITRTEYLGMRWTATEFSDGSMTLRGPAAFDRIDLEPDSVEKLRQFFAEAKAQARAA